MPLTAKVTSKGQITLPKSAREALGADVVEIEIGKGQVVLRPVQSLAGALRKYVREGKPLNEIRDEVWGEVVRESES